MDRRDIHDFKTVLESVLSNTEQQTTVIHEDLKLSKISDTDSLGEALFRLFRYTLPLILIRSSSSDDEDDLFRSDTESETFSRPRQTDGRQTESSRTTSNDVEGSPLKLQIYADFSFSSQSSETFTPMPKRKRDCTESGIPLSRARKIISYFCLAYDYNNRSKTPELQHDSLPSLLILCDGLDVKRTACMYVEPTHQTEADKQTWNGWRIASVHVKDPDSGGSNSHLLNFQKLNVSGKKVSCEAIYDIFDTLQDNGGYQIDRYQGTLLLEARWEKLSVTPPLDDTRTVIKAKVSSGDTRSAAHTLFKSLEVLKFLVAGLDTAVVNWVQEEDETCKPVMENLKELLERLKLGDACQLGKKDETGDEDLDCILDALVFNERKDMDFTDHLWIVLSKCTSFTELVNCLKYVFNLLSNGELRPMVHRNNQTTLAQLVRESYTGKLRMPSLMGLYPLQLLAEIGAEKLQQDYLFTYLSKELVTHSSLEVFLKTDIKLEDRLINLEKLHHVLEMIVMLKLFLNLPTMNLAICARVMLSHYEQADVASDYLFTFPMLTSSLKHVFEAHQPCVKQIKLSKAVGSVIESEDHLFMTKQPFKHLPITPETMMDPDTTLDRSGKYFYVKKQESISVLI